MCVIHSARKKAKHFQHVQGERTTFHCDHPHSTKKDEHDQMQQGALITESQQISMEGKVMLMRSQKQLSCLVFIVCFSLVSLSQLLFIQEQKRRENPAVPSSVMGMYSHIIGIQLEKSDGTIHCCCSVTLGQYSGCPKGENKHEHLIIVFVHCFKRNL